MVVVPMGTYDLCPFCTPGHNNGRRVGAVLAHNTMLWHQWDAGVVSRPCIAVCLGKFSATIVNLYRDTIVLFFKQMYRNYLFD